MKIRPFVPMLTMLAASVIMALLMLQARNAQRKHDELMKAIAIYAVEATTTRMQPYDPAKMPPGFDQRQALAYEYGTCANDCMGIQALLKREEQKRKPHRHKRAVKKSSYTGPTGWPSWWPDSVEPTWAPAIVSHPNTYVLMGKYDCVYKLDDEQTVCNAVAKDGVRAEP